MASLKAVKKGDKVILRLFTGAFSGVKVVEKADKDFIYFETRKGMSKFSRKTGKMLEPASKSEAYASYIEEYDEDVEAAEIAKKEKVQKSEPAPKKPSKAKEVKKPAGKPKAKQPEPEDDDDEDYEEVD